MEITEAGGDDVRALARTLARAFDDDPITEFLFPFPDERTRLRRNAAAYRVFLRQQLRREHPVHLAGDGASVALWVPPDEWKVPLGETLRGALPSVAALRSRTRAAFRGFAALERAHPRDPPHWYLALLGTDPDHQGKGYGSAVMEPVLGRCDDEGVHAFLESSKERNLPFYERHGFEVTGQLTFGLDGPPLWQMLRAPR